MARKMGKIHSSIWRDDDWRGLTGDAQRLYLLVMSQPKMSLCGVIDYTPDRWVSTCVDWTADQLDEALEELQAARFLLYDPKTAELAVRTFVRHDFDPSRWNRNLTKGLWSAWESVESEYLRSEVVHEIPVEIWSKIEEHAPPSALQTRRSEGRKRSVPTDRSNGPSERSDQTVRPNGPPEPMYTYTHTHTSLQPTDRSPSEAAAADEIPAPLTDRERTRLFHEAVEVLVRRTVDRKPAESNPTGYERALRLGKRTDHAARAMALIDSRPDIDADELADHLEPTARPADRPGDESVQRRRAFELLSNPRCERCHGTTWLDAPLLDDDTWGPPEPCPDCNDEARTA